MTATPIGTPTPSPRDDSPEPPASNGDKAKAVAKVLLGSALAFVVRTLPGLVFAFLVDTFGVYVIANLIGGLDWSLRELSAAGLAVMILTFTIRQSGGTTVVNDFSDDS